MATQKKHRSPRTKAEALRDDNYTGSHYCVRCTQKKRRCVFEKGKQECIFCKLEGTTCQPKRCRHFWTNATLFILFSRTYATLSRTYATLSWTYATLSNLSFSRGVETSPQTSQKKHGGFRCHYSYSSFEE